MVDIVDVNDNAPLLQPFDGAVLENTDSTLITTIQAVDKDASPQVTLHLKTVVVITLYL